MRGQEVPGWQPAIGELQRDPGCGLVCQGSVPVCGVQPCGVPDTRPAGSSSEPPRSGVCRATADNDFPHNMIRKAVEGKDINHKGQGRAPHPLLLPR